MRKPRAQACGYFFTTKTIDLYGYCLVYFELAN